MNNKELWVQNISNSDVSLSDLGLKVPVGKSVNVFAANPYVTEGQVASSMESGSLYKRLNDHGVLRLVVRKPQENLAAIKKVYEDNTGSAYAKKTKSSVVIESKGVNITEDEAFDFADYGVDIGNDVSQVREKGSVFVEQKEDPANEPEPGSPLAPKTSAGPAQRQSSILMKHQSDSQANPFGKVAENKAPGAETPFVVSAPPEAEPQEAMPTPEEPKVEKQHDGSIAVAGKTKHRNIAEIAGNKDLAEESFIKDEAKYDARVATKSEDGAIVMKLKEEAKEEVKQEKPKPARKAKPKTSKKE